jgi:hypothetical protein
MLPPPVPRLDEEDDEEEEVEGEETAQDAGEATAHSPQHIQLC